MFSKFLFRPACGDKCFLIFLYPLLRFLHKLIHLFLDHLVHLQGIVLHLAAGRAFLRNYLRYLHLQFLVRGLLFIRPEGKHSGHGTYYRDSGCGHGEALVCI